MAEKLTHERYGYDSDESFFVDMGKLDENGLGEEMTTIDVVERLNSSQAEVEALEAKATRNRWFADFYRRKALDYKAEVEALGLFKMILAWMVAYQPEMVHSYVMGHHALDPFDLPAFFRAFPTTDLHGWMAEHGEAMDRMAALAAAGKPE